MFPGSDPGNVFTDPEPDVFPLRANNKSAGFSGWFFFITEILVAVVGFPFLNHGFAGTAYAFTAQAFDLRGVVVLSHLQNGHVLWHYELASGTRQHQGKFISVFIG